MKSTYLKADLVCRFKKVPATLLAALLGVSSHSFAAGQQPSSFLARIVNVSDGDTVVALDGQNNQVRVRLANIDAPETGHGRCKPGQPFSDKSKDYLAGMVKGKEVVLTCFDQDRYGRSICDISVGTSTASRELARAGLAWANRARPSYLRDAGVAQAEQEAMQKRVGLWGDLRAAPPWEWRKTAWGAPPGCGPDKDFP
jgi:micrococcal nuclease